MSNLKTIHVISQAHLDPVWLWPWTAGLDEALGTCRTACNLLDEYKNYIFTAGEAWRYLQIETLDPDLFDRIKRHVQNGRWEIVNGWWIQADCNFPSGFALERQISVGKRYLLDRFGVFSEVGYNVDTFGHAASLPGYMRAAGQKYYVMMRPQEHEMNLPARLFRWRGFPGTPEIVTFRIAGSYGGKGVPLSLDHICASTTNLPDSVKHTMCFVGAGDHGGGPTADLIEWIEDNAEALAGWRMVLSSPSRFFRAIGRMANSLPLVTGELQSHAIGCYTVQRGLKTRVRRAEHRLRQAEIVAGKRDASVAAGIAEAWRKVAFNHFHDIVGGTCVPSAYPQLYDQLGCASNTADEIIQYDLRRRMVALPDDDRQRIVLLNASDSAFDGYVEHEPWVEGRPWHKGWRLMDKAGKSIPLQIVASESQIPLARLFFRIKARPGEMQTVRIDRSKDNETLPSRVQAAADSIFADTGVGVRVNDRPRMSFTGGVRLPLPRFDLIEDRTDNWSHGTDRYPEGPIASPVWNAPSLLDSGPLMASLFQAGTIGSSALRAEWRVYAGEPFVDLRLLVHWCERLKILKMTLLLPKEVKEREDGIPGASLVRLNNGAERPLRDWTMCRSGKRARFGVVSPDVYALDATAARIRLTLLRSPIMTHHDPWLATSPRGMIADQGEHEFRFRFFCGAGVTAKFLERQALMMHRPLVAADLTKGMPRRLKK